MEEVSGDGIEGRTNYQLASAVKPAKKPPPERPESIRLRTLVILSFWATVIFLGLPVWLWTTSIHRARLPLQEMLEWAHGKACKPTFPLQIVIEAPSLPESEAAHLVRLTQHALDDLNEFSAHHLRLRLAKPSTPPKDNNASISKYQSFAQDELLESRSPSTEQENFALRVRLQPDRSARTEIQSHSTTLDISYNPNQLPSLSSSSSTLATMIATQLQAIFTEEQAIMSYILSLRSHQSKPMNSELAARLASRMTRSLKYAPTYHITISLFTPAATPSSWEIEEAISDYLKPLLDSISIVSNFTVDTQVQLFATLSPSVHPPEYDPERSVWTLREEDLSGFINAAEWPLSPSIGAGPTLNFVLYASSQATSPLVVKGSQATSWLIPQWGGVVILNPEDLNTEVSMLSKSTIQPALLTFSHQLLSLLGAPQSPPSLPLQLQTLVRIRAASLLLTASSTMGSLANLTIALPSIAIPETVSNAVDNTLTHLRQTCNALKQGKFQEALESARTAEVEAERGFFEKSMVGQVYFPDEHKVAVYLPLLGPVGVPLIMSAFKEVKRVWTTWKTNKSAI